MSMYAVVLQALRGDTGGKTSAQLATNINVPLSAVTDALNILVQDGRVTNTAGTYTETAGREDR